jgi:hypothetical protein
VDTLSFLVLLIVAVSAWSEANQEDRMAEALDQELEQLEQFPHPPPIAPRDPSYLAVPPELLEQSEEAALRESGRQSSAQTPTLRDPAGAATPQAVENPRPDAEIDRNTQ